MNLEMDCVWSRPPFLKQTYLIGCGAVYDISQFKFGITRAMNYSLWGICKRLLIFRCVMLEFFLKRPCNEGIFTNAVSRELKYPECSYNSICKTNLDLFWWGWAFKYNILQGKKALLGQKQRGNNKGETVKGSCR